MLTGEFDEDANLIDWGPDGIYFTALQKTTAHLYRIDPATRAVRRISAPDAFHASGASFTKDHRSAGRHRRRAESFCGNLYFVYQRFRCRIT